MDTLGTNHSYLGILCLFGYQQSGNTPHSGEATFFRYISHSPRGPPTIVSDPRLVPRILHALGVGTLPGPPYSRSQGLKEVHLPLLAKYTSHGIRFSGLQLSRAPMRRSNAEKTHKRLRGFTSGHKSTSLRDTRQDISKHVPLCRRQLASYKVCVGPSPRTMYHLPPTKIYTGDFTTFGTSRRPSSRTTGLTLTTALTPWCHIALRRAQGLRFTPATHGQRDYKRYPR